jgi:hypothetical protein
MWMAASDSAVAAAFTEFAYRSRPSSRKRAAFASASCAARHRPLARSAGDGLRCCFAMLFPIYRKRKQPGLIDEAMHSCL